MMTNEKIKSKKQKVRPLTDKVIKSIKPTDKLQKKPDGESLFLFVFPTGGKVFKLLYRFNGKQNTYTLGEYPLLSLAEARIMKAKIKTLLAQGIDPNYHKKEAKAQKMLEESGAGTFEVVASEWLENHRYKVGDKQYIKLSGVLKNHINPVIGKLKLEAVTSQGILDLSKRIEAKGLKDIPKVAIRAIGQVYNYAIATGQATNSPCHAGLSAYLTPHIETNHPHIELGQLGALLRSLEGIKSSPIVVIGLKLVILLAPRQSELRACKWAYLDRRKGVLTIPSELMKGTLKNKREGKLEHDIPLSTQAVKLFEQLHSLTGNNQNGLMFPSSLGQGKIISDGTLNKALKQTGYYEQQNIHGFRSLLSTYLNEVFPEKSDLIEKMLSHQVGDKVKRAYDRSKQLEHRRELYQHWADYLESQGLKI